MTGTPFQNRVWNEIKNIPAGQTRTYKEIAVSIGIPVHQELLPMLAQPTQIQSLTMS
ncbi:MAG: hypothetical protein Ct9H90mP26_2400 [Methanobacteriota archaeon]|nr:MAG: hypothetical protein Ct9H90mP26_2400 [Euryarchaeota archaeon]